MVLPIMFATPMHAMARMIAASPTLFMLASACDNEISEQLSESVAFSQRPESSLVHPVVVPFVSQSHNREVAQKTVAVSGLFILARFVHKPNTVQAVLATVITDAELPTNFFLPSGCCSVCVNKANS